MLQVCLARDCTVSSQAVSLIVTAAGAATLLSRKHLLVYTSARARAEVKAAVVDSLLFLPLLPLPSTASNRVIALSYNCTGMLRSLLQEKCHCRRTRPS